MEFSKTKSIRRLQIIIDCAITEGWSSEELSKALSKPRQFYGRTREVKLNIGEGKENEHTNSSKNISDNSGNILDRLTYPGLSKSGKPRGDTERKSN